MSKKTHMNIGGMTCIHCQNKIEKALKNTKGVIKASVSYKRGIADIEYDDSVTNVNKLAKVIEIEDYKVLSSEGKISPGITETLGILVIIAALYYLLQTFGLLNHLVPDRLADSGMGYGMLFVIGLITSVHCIAMCGGIGLSQSLPSGKEAKALLPAALYNLGRVCSYTAIGFVLGLGSVVSLLGKKFTKQVMRVGAILVVVLGLAMFTQGTALSGLMSMVQTHMQMHTGGSADAAAAEGEAPEDIAEENGNVTDKVQEIRSTLTRGSYPEITVQAGIPVRWIIDAPAENINGCNSVMIVPNYGIQHAFEPGENIIEFTPTESGSFSYSCWMGMVYGSINVVE